MKFNSEQICVVTVHCITVLTDHLTFNDSYCYRRRKKAAFMITLITECELIFIYLFIFSTLFSSNAYIKTFTAEEQRKNKFSVTLRPKTTLSLVVDLLKKCRKLFIYIKKIIYFRYINFKFVVR